MDLETESKLYAQNGKLLLASTTLLFLLLLVIVFLHTFRHSCFRRRRNNHRHRHRVEANSSTAALNKGIDPSLLASLPTFTHSLSSSAAGDGCAVCMSVFAAGDEGRVLPSCRHAFHSHCIDAWFGSHSNCPLCRTPVRPGLMRWFPEPVWCLKKPLELEEEKLKNSYCINITLAPHM